MIIEVTGCFVFIEFQSSGAAQICRRNSVDRNTAGSAIVLATVGLSVSMFSLKQMLSSQMPQNRLRRLH